MSTPVALDNRTSARPALRLVTDAPAAPAPAPTAERSLPAGTAPRGFALYVGFDEAKAAASGVSLGTIVEALRRDFGKPEPEVILTEILPSAIFLTQATLSFPENREAPIAADLHFQDAADIKVHAEFDWRPAAQQGWDIIVTTAGGELRLTDGGARLWRGRRCGRRRCCGWCRWPGRRARTTASGSRPRGNTLWAVSPQSSSRQMYVRTVSVRSPGS